MNMHVTQGAGYPTGDRVVPMVEAAVISGLSVDTLKRLNKDGELEIIRLSARRIGIRLSTLMEFIAQRAA